MKPFVKSALIFGSARALDLSAALLALARPVPKPRVDDPVPDTRYSNLAMWTLVDAAEQAMIEGDYARFNLVALAAHLGNTARPDNPLLPFLGMKPKELTTALKAEGAITVTINGARSADDMDGADDTEVRS